MTKINFEITGNHSGLDRALSASGSEFAEFANKAVASIENVNKHFEAVRAEVARGFNINTASFSDVARRGEAVYNSTRTAAERFAIKKRELNDLHRVGAIDTDTYGRALSRAKGEILGQVGIYDRWKTAIKQTWDNFKGLALAYAGARGVSWVGQKADEMVRLDGQIRRTTASEREYEQVQKRLFDISRETRTEMGATTKLYSRSALALHEYGYNNQQVLKFTELTNKAMAVGGAEATEQAAALYQLSQALASGKLQGDEFRSIAEQSPIFLDIMSQSLGVSRGELRKWASDGKLTTDIIMKSMLGQADAIDEAFKKAPMSVGTASTKIGTSVSQIADKYLVQTGVMNALAQSISFAADHLESLMIGGIAAASALGGMGAMSFIASGGLGTMAAAATSASRALLSAAMSNPFTATAAAIGLAVTVLYEYRDATIEVAGEQTTLGQAAADIWEGIKLTASEAIDAAKTAVTNKINEILSAFQLPSVTWAQVWGAIKSVAAQVTANVYDMTFGLARNVASAFEWMASRAKAALNGIISAAGEAMSAAKSAGSALLSGDFSGAWGAIKGANVKGAFNAAYDAAPKADFTRASTKDFAAVSDFASGLYTKGRNHRQGNAIADSYTQTGAGSGKSKAAGAGAGGGGGKGKKGKGGGGGSDNRVNQWAEELEAEKRAYQLKNDLREMSVADEIAFWAKKKALTANGSKAAADIQKKIDALSFSDAKQTLKNTIEINEVERDFKQKSALADIDDALSAAKFEQDMGRINAKQLIEIERQLEIERAQIVADGVRARIAILAQDPTKNAVEIAKLNKELENLEREHQRRLTGLNREAAKEAQTRWAGVTDSISNLWDKGLDAMMNGTLTWKNATKAILADLGRAFAKMGADELKTWMMNKTRQIVFGKAAANIEKATNRSIEQDKRLGWFGSLRAFMMNTLRKMGIVRTTAVQERMIEQTTAGGKQNLWIGGLQKLVGLKTQELGITKTIDTAKQAVESAGAAKSVGITIGAATPKIMANATTAASGAASSQASIPYIGPVLAAAAMAAMLATVGGLTSSLPSARGGWHVPAGMNPLTQLHEKEMVLPAKHAAVIDNLANGGGATGAAATHHYSVPVNYYDNSGKLTPEDINRNSRHIARALEKELRKFTVKV